VALLPMLFPKSQPKGDLVTVCFGANDAAMAGIPQHVPLQEFSANMAAVLDWLHECFHRVIVLTCPPVDEKRRLEYQVEKYGSKATGVLERTNERAQMYAAAAATTARKANAPVIDLWSGMQEEAVGSRPWLLPPPARHSPAGAVLPRLCRHSAGSAARPHAWAWAGACPRALSLRACHVWGYFRCPCRRAGKPCSPTGSISPRVASGLCLRSWARTRLSPTSLQGRTISRTPTTLLITPTRVQAS